ncbi:MAG TPA: 50S ribosomal protein L32 [Armatimonadota bacterium]|nr:50S ribosomal protein L32 [Armatimonadota bacterium]HOJ22186.1 50S ribosomal protein L32 [Armatimonadota bacterium]HOM81969.1 50S ribosomal protein L32 [Armatimonadota bacterium]HOQ27882.1 50S ribosomal protein L32 [Armatimonadota bacterium]HPO72035.1 50S ribosomal protein L32 [Armatimonadota bacterium]
MALPKRKTSKSNRDSRRTHWKLKLPEVSPCPRCRQPRLAHHVCRHCGYYNDRRVIEVKTEEKE